jgi:DNA-binding NtrC family response regulator
MNTKRKLKVLVLDDEHVIRFGIREFLECGGYEIVEATTCREAQHLFCVCEPDAAILDYSLPDGNALELLPRLQSVDSSVPIIILTAHGSIDLAVQAIKQGADQFLTKPVELSALVVVLERALENQRNRQNNIALKKNRGGTLADPFIGTSSAIKRVADTCRKVVSADSVVLINGETGTGKGVLARWFHENGPRVQHPLVDLNCAGLSQELLESELFGYEKGAFTGAVNSKVGLVEVAHRGTLFLDEIGDVGVAIQPKLLKILEERRFHRLGDVRERRVDVRLIAATHRDLPALIREDKFRSDLYFRINTIQVTLPALRLRVEDIPVIAESLLHELAVDLGRPGTALSGEAMSALETYNWPGNIRELRNVLERAILLADDALLRASDLKFESTTATMASQWLSPGTGTLADMERQQIQRALEETGGQMTNAARLLGIAKSTLYHKLRDYNLNVIKSGLAGRKLE